MPDGQPLREIAEKRVTVSQVAMELEKLTQNLARAETFGDASPPIPVYEGPTARRKPKAQRHRMAHHAIL